MTNEANLQPHGKYYIPFVYITSQIAILNNYNYV